MGSGTGALMVWDVCKANVLVWMAWLGVNAGEQDLIHIDIRHLCVFCSKKKK